MTQVSENLEIDSQDQDKTAKSLQQAHNNLESLSAKVMNSVANAAGVTWTASQMVSGVIVRSGAAAVSDTTPTAAAIVAAIKHPVVGQCFDLEVVNTNSGTLTIVAGTNVTLAGTTTIATVNTRRYRCKLTNVTSSSEAVTLQGLSTAAN